MQGGDEPLSGQVYGGWVETRLKSRWVGSGTSSHGASAEAISIFKDATD